MARVITAEQAVAQGIGPASLRQVAAWNAAVADAERTRNIRVRDTVTMERCGGQAAALLRIADAVEQLGRRAA